MSKPRTTRRRGALPVPALVLAVLLGACVSPEMRSDEGRGRVLSSSASPAWVGEPLDWSKLEGIERWLERDADGHEPYWTVQAELILAEGRLTFTRREEAQGPGGDEQALLARLQSSRAGFQRVLEHPEANAAQRARARRGQAEVESLRTAMPHARPTSSGHLARSVWRAAAPVPSRLTPARGGYDRITIHHTAEVPGARFDGSMSDSIRVLQNAQRNHMANRGYGDIGYHYLIDAAGRVFLGRSLAYQGAHAGGANNVRNIGVCLLGNFEHGRPSPSAMGALEALLRGLRAEHRIPRTRIVGHGELKATQCPGAVLARWTRQYRKSGPALSSLGSGSSQTPRREVGVRAAVAQSPGAARPRTAGAAPSRTWRRDSTVR